MYAVPGSGKHFLLRIGSFEQWSHLSLNHGHFKQWKTTAFIESE